MDEEGEGAKRNLNIRLLSQTEVAELQVLTAKTTVSLSYSE